MKHEDFAKYWLLRDDEGNVLQVNTEEAEPPKIVFTEGSVAPEWYNALRAAGAMYNQLSAQYNALQDLIDVSETVTGPNNPIIRTFIELQNAILLTQQVAREGVEKVGGMLDKQPKSS
jgi:hypothetical protein